MCLDLDNARLETDERMSDRACEHVVTLGNEACWFCANDVPIAHASHLRQPKSGG